MIIFLYKDRHLYTHSSLIEDEGLGEIECRNYSWLLDQKKMPKAAYIFTDLERMDLWELRVYGALFNHLNNSGIGYRAINDPAKMMSRRALLRTLYLEGINDFNVYTLIEKLMPKKYPVFLRREYDHERPLSDLLNNEQELEEALNRLRDDREPEDGVLITEYCAKPVEGTLFRKLSSYRIGGQTLFYDCYYENTWLVKYGEKNAATDALYKEEYEMVRDNAFEDEISKVFEIANIEYGRVDFGLVNGKIQIYEINTNPRTRAPNNKTHDNSLKKESYLLAWEKYSNALSALDTIDVTGPFASRFTHVGLSLYQKPKFLKQPLNYLGSLFCRNSPKPTILR